MDALITKIETAIKEWEGLAAGLLETIQLSIDAKEEMVDRESLWSELNHAEGALFGLRAARNWAKEIKQAETSGAIKENSNG